MERRAAAIHRHLAVALGTDRSLAEVRIRARLRADVDAAMRRVDANEAVGLPPGDVDDHSLSAEQMREVLDAFCALPSGDYRIHIHDYRNASGHGWSADWPMRCLCVSRRESHGRFELLVYTIQLGPGPEHLIKSSEAADTLPRFHLARKPSPPDFAGRLRGRLGEARTSTPPAQESTTMTTYRAATYLGLPRTLPAECILSDADLIVSATAEIRKVGLPEGASDEDFLRDLVIESYTDHGVSGLDIEDVLMTADNISHVRALLPADIASEVDVGKTVSIHTKARAAYTTVAVFQPTNRAAVVDQDGTISWGDVENDDYVRLYQHDDEGCATVVSIHTGKNVSAEVSQIDVKLREDSIRCQEGCDTDEAVQAIVQGVYNALCSNYPHAQVEVEANDDPIVVTTVEVFSGDYVLDGDDRQTQVEDVIRRAIERTISDGAWDDAAA